MISIIFPQNKNMKNKIKVKRVSSDGRIIEDGILDLESFEFTPWASLSILKPIKIPMIENMYCDLCAHKPCICYVNNRR